MQLSVITQRRSEMSQDADFKLGSCKFPEIHIGKVGRVSLLAFLFIVVEKFFGRLTKLAVVFHKNYRVASSCATRGNPSARRGGASIITTLHRRRCSTNQERRLKSRLFLLFLVPGRHLRHERRMDDERWQGEGVVRVWMCHRGTTGEEKAWWYSLQGNYVFYSGLGRKDYAIKGLLRIPKVPEECCQKGYRKLRYVTLIGGKHRKVSQECPRRGKVSKRAYQERIVTAMLSHTLHPRSRLLIGDLDGSSRYLPLATFAFMSRLCARPSQPRCLGILRALNP